MGVGAPQKEKISERKFPAQKAKISHLPYEFVESRRDLTTPSRRQNVVGGSFVGRVAWRTSLTFQKKVKIEADASDVSARVNAQARSKHAIYAGGAIRYHSYVMISQIHGRPTNTSKSRTPLWWWTAVTSSSAHTTRTVRHVLRQRR